MVQGGVMGSGGVTLATATARRTITACVGCLEDVQRDESAPSLAPRMTTAGVGSPKDVERGEGIPSLAPHVIAVMVQSGVMDSGVVKHATAAAPRMITACVDCFEDVQYQLAALSLGISLRTRLRATPLFLLTPGHAPRAAPCIGDFGSRPDRLPRVFRAPAGGEE